MRAFFAIVKLTLRNASRSHIFQLLVGVLVLCVLVVPTVLSGDGTAAGFIQVALLYSMSAVTLVLALSSVWVSCYAMTQDVESYQIHMVVTKPVSRWIIWLAKFFAVIMMHGVLLFAAMTGIYFLIMAQFERQDFKEEDRNKIRETVMLGRRVFMPEPLDFNAIARQKARNRLNELADEGKKVDLSEEMQTKLFKEMRQSAIIDDAKVEPGEYREWIFNGVPNDGLNPLFLNYRVYVNKVGTQEQRMTSGAWKVGMVFFEKDGSGIEDPATAQVMYSSPIFQTVKSGDFHEIPLRSSVPLVTPDNKVYIYYQNLDPQSAPQYFVPGDGPKLMMRITGFAENFFRGVLVIFIELVILSGLACAAASILSMPTAIFASVAYLLFGTFAKYLTEVGLAESGDTGSYYLGKAVLLFVIPLQDFGVVDQISHGELIEFAAIGKLMLYYFSYRALPIFALGAWLYRRRELGLVVRK